jgi:Na+/H+-dicarboxylate symporter
MDMLGIIMFSCTFGFVLAAMPSEKTEKVLQIVESLNMAIQKMVGLGNDPSLSR